jgi:hypothetical protein
MGIGLVGKAENGQDATAIGRFVLQRVNISGSGENAVAKRSSKIAGGTSLGSNPLDPLSSGGAVLTGYG